MHIAPVRGGGYTLLELMTVVAITGMVLAIAAPEFQRYLLRAKAAGVVIEAQSIIRLIQEHQGTIDKNQHRLELFNGADGSISGCPVPVGSTCAAAGTAPVVVVRPELLLITNGAIRVSAAPCYVDCPGFALNFSSDVDLVPAPPAAPTTPAGSTAPAEPAAPSPTTPVDPVPAEPEQGKGSGKGSGKGKQSELERSPRWPMLSWLDVPLVPSALRQ